MPTGPRSGGVARRRSVDHASAASPHASTPYSGSRKCAGRTGLPSGKRSAITRPASGTTHGQRSAAAVPTTNAPSPPTPAATTSSGDRSTASASPGACASMRGMAPTMVAAIPDSRRIAPRSTSSSATPSAATRPAIGSSSSDVTARRESSRGVSARGRDADGAGGAAGVREHDGRLAGQLAVDLEHRHTVALQPSRRRTDELDGRRRDAGDADRDAVRSRPPRRRPGTGSRSARPAPWPTRSGASPGRAAAAARAGRSRTPRAAACRRGAARRAARGRTAAGSARARAPRRAPRHRRSCGACAFAERLNSVRMSAGRAVPWVASNQKPHAS